MDLKTQSILYQVCLKVASQIATSEALAENVLAYADELFEGLMKRHMTWEELYAAQRPAQPEPQPVASYPGVGPCPIDGGQVVKRGKGPWQCENVKRVPTDQFTAEGKQVYKDVGSCTWKSWEGPPKMPAAPIPQPQADSEAVF